MPNLKTIVDIPVDAYELADSLHMALKPEEMQQFIKEIDLQYADAGFTEDLIILLLQSLKEEVVDEKEQTAVDNICNQIKNIEYGL